MTKQNSSRLLEDLEFKVAKGVDDTSVVQAIQRDRDLRAIQRDRDLRAASTRSAAANEHQNIGNRVATTHPKKRRLKQAARKTLEKLTTKEAQKVAEFQLPAGLQDYVSGGIKQFNEYHNLSTLRKAAPYAIGIAAGADILASRDKTGPFWGGVAAGLAWLLTRGKVSKNTRLLASGGAYAAGRILGGALATAHSGQLEGFPERGFAVAERRVHTDFGSGWRGILGAPKAIKNVFKRILSRTLGKKPIPSFKNVRPNPTLQNWTHNPEGEFSGPWIDRFHKIGEPYIESGIKQSEIVSQQKKAGTFYDLLPVVRHDSYSIKVGEVSSKARPTMQLTTDEVSNALTDYARERGIKNVPNFWNTAGKSAENSSSLINFPAVDAVSIAIGEDSPTGELVKAMSSGQVVSKSARLISSAKAITRQEGKIRKGGSRPRSVNEAIQAAGAPTPAFHHPVGPFDTDRVRAARPVMKTIVETPELDVRHIAKAENNFRRDYSDFANAQSYGALMRRSRPRVLESFKKNGIVGFLRKKNTEGDFGTGWDPARRFAKALFGKAAREGTEQVARGATFKDILRNEEFQKAITSGDAKVIKQLGAGGVGSVELMETTIGKEKFRFARKTYFGDDVGQAARSSKSEAEGLRAMQGTIAPTPYGRGTVVKKGREVPALYFEAIEDATPAAEAFAEQGGATKAQAKALEGALKDLHSKGLYHSDVKPANMLVDKENRLVLIDPMPGRYDSMGKGVSKAVGQEQDMTAAKVLASGGKPADVTSDMNILANSLFYAHGGEQRYPKYYERGVQYAQGLFKRSGLIMSKTAEVYRIPMVPVSQVSKAPSVGSMAVKTANNRPGGVIKTASQSLSKTARPGQMPSVLGEDATSIARTAGRQQLHEVSMRTMASNNTMPARRHRTM